VSSEESSYKQILKSSSIIGGTQIFTILIQIIRSKIIAVIIGTTGFGILGLLQTTISLISNLTNGGLGVSSVRDLSEAYSKKDYAKTTMVVSVVKKLVIITGLLGTGIMLFFSKYLSKIVFGNGNYTLHFAFASVTLFLMQFTVWQNVILQGTRNINYLAKSNMIGSTIGLILTVPLYYIFKIEGIIPAIIISALITPVVTSYFVKKINIPTSKVSFKNAFIQGKDMINLGMMLNLGLIISQITSFIIRTFIGRSGGLEQVGLYSAAFTIINGYMNIIFTAMSTDYYPRLCSVSHDNEKSYNMINQQAEIILIVLGPILIVFISFIHYGILILYSQKFLGINLMLQFAAIAMLFKGASFSVAHLFLAKGASKIYFWNELVSNIYLLILNILGYYFWGLNGIGISFLLGYFLYFFQVLIVARIYYNYKISKDFVKLILIQTLLVSAMLLLVLFFNTQFYLKILLIMITFLISYKLLSKKIDIKNIIKRK